MSECLCPGCAGGWNGGSGFLPDIPPMSLILSRNFCRKVWGWHLQNKNKNKQINSNNNKKKPYGIYDMLEPVEKK